MKKKRFTGIILAVMILAMSVFTGCSLVTRNWERYYNAVVSTITDKNNKKINITKRELIQAYGSYGYYYEQYYGKSRQEAIELTLSQLESRKLMINEAEMIFTEKNGGDVLTKKEKAYLWTQTNNSVRDNFLTYVNQVTGTSTSEEEEDSDAIKFNGYSKQAELGSEVRKDKDGNVLKDGNGNPIQDYVIEKKNPLGELLEDFDYVEAEAKDIDIKADKELIYTNLRDLVDSAKGSEVYSKAYNEYRKALKKSEEGLSFKENTDKDLFLREIDRLYKINYENFLIEKYSDSFKDKTTRSDVTVNQMLELYTNKVLSSYNQYVLEGDDDYENDVLSGLGNINYFKRGDEDTKFYTVSHILFKYSEEAEALYKQAKTDLDNGKINAIQYREAIKDLPVYPTVREKDENGIYQEIDKKDYKAYELTVTDLYNHINERISSISDPIKKAEAFNEYIYKYNEDPGIRNAEYNYVMGVNKAEAQNASEDDLITISGDRTYKKYSQMVEEFTLAGAELYNDGLGQIGDLSGMVATENGIHILMYTGECKNLFDSIVEGLNGGQEVPLGDGAIEVLYNSRLNVCVDKTIFDVLYEELAQDNFATFEAENIRILKEGCKIARYEGNYKDLFNA